MKKPQYIKIYNDLLSPINNGELKEGDQLPTEMELSQKYGVSRITSKKALDMLSQEGRIIRIAGKGSFVSTNAHSFAPERKGTPIIGVVMSNFSSAFGIDFFSGIQQACQKHESLAVISNAYSNQESETAEISRLIRMGACGLILMPLHGLSYNPAILENLLNNFPMVMADRFLPGLSVPYVGNDNVHSAEDAIRYLFERGHKKVAFFSSLATTSALQERMEGYINAYASSDFSLDKELMVTDIHCTMPGMNTKEYIQADLECIKAFFLRNPQVSAGLAADYWIARFLHTALRQIEKEIPQDFSLICYDQPEELFFDCNYTHIQQNQYQIGYQAANILFRILENKPLEQEKHLIDYALVEGTTVSQLIR